MNAERSQSDKERGLDDIVVGLDGSEASNTALRWTAAQLAPGGRIRAVHVVVPDDDVALDDSHGDRADTRDDTGDEIGERWIASAFGGEPHPGIVAVVREGHVAEQLLQIADEVNADAIVVGHHAQARLGPQVVGHVTAELLHDADRPVVVVPLDWTPERTDGRPVAVGVGVSKGTQVALRWALEHTRYCGHGLVLAHAHGPRSLFRPDGWLDVLAYYLDPTVLHEWVERDLLDLAEELRAETGADVDVSVSVETGRTGARLVEAGSGAGMLVVGRGEPPFLGGRTIAPYLRHAIVHAPCPIVVVPTPER